MGARGDALSSPMSTTHQPDTRSRAYAIAARAGVDHRPVAEWLRGGPLPRGAIGERIAIAARDLGIAPHGSSTAPPAPDGGPLAA